MTEIQQPYDYLPIESSFSFEYPPETGIKCTGLDHTSGSPCKLHIQQVQELQDLRKKISKKDQLIKYLQRKCGNQIIKATRKLYDKINKLEAENARLQKYIDTNKTHMNVLTRSMEHTFGECSPSGLLLTPVPITTQAQVRTPRSRKAIEQQYKGELLKLSTQELSEIVVTQTHSLRKMEIINEKHINISSNYKSGSKGKKQKVVNILNCNALRKQLGKDRQCENQQNENQTNVLSSTAADKSKNKSRNKQQPTSLQLGLFRSPNLLNLTNDQNQPLLTKVSSTEFNICVITSKTTTEQQTQPSAQPQMRECETQTTQTAADIGHSLKQLQHLKASMDTLQKDNQALREQAMYFAEKIQDYYQEYEQNDDHGLHDYEFNIDMDAHDEAKHSNRKSHGHEYQQKTRLIIQSYGQILEIFGICDGRIRSLYDQTSMPSCQQHERVHHKLMQQICNTKLQISQLLKQYRFLQKQLHTACSATNHLEAYINDIEQRHRQSEQYCGQLTTLVTDLNDQIMALKWKQTDYLVKTMNVKRAQAQTQTQIQIGIRQCTEDSEQQDTGKAGLSDLETVHSDSNINILLLPSQSNISQTDAVATDIDTNMGMDGGNGAVCCN